MSGARREEVEPEATAQSINTGRNLVTHNSRVVKCGGEAQRDSVYEIQIQPTRAVHVNAFLAVLCVGRSMYVRAKRFVRLCKRETRDVERLSTKQREKNK